MICSKYFVWIYDSAEEQKYRCMTTSPGNTKMSKVKGGSETNLKEGETLPSWLPVWQTHSKNWETGIPDSSSSSCQQECGQVWGTEGEGSTETQWGGCKTTRIITKLFIGTTGSTSAPSYHHQEVQCKLCTVLQKFPLAFISQHSNRREICSRDPGTGEKWSWADMLFLKWKMDFGQANKL